jgi:putative flippase GtrA
MSGLSFLVNSGLTIFVHEILGAPTEFAFALALLTVFIMNFYLLRYYVYQGADNPAGQQFLEYASSAISFRGLEYLSFLLLHTWFDYEYKLVLVSILLISSIVKFLWYQYLFESKIR